MTLTLPQDATNASIFITIVDNAGDVVTGLTFESIDLDIDYFLDNGIEFVPVNLVGGAISSYAPGKFLELPAGSGTYRFSLPPGAIRPRGTTLLRVRYSDQEPLLGVISFSGPIVYPANFGSMQITSTGRVRNEPSNINFSFNVDNSGTVIGTNGIVYTKESGRIIKFEATEDIEYLNLRIIFEDDEQNDLLILTDYDLTKVGNEIEVELDAVLTQNPGTVSWAIRDEVTGQVYGTGEFIVTYAPEEDLT